MREIDEVRVEGNVLTIYDTKGERHRFKMGAPEQVYEEIVRTLAPSRTITYSQQRPVLPYHREREYPDMSAKEVQS